MSIIDIPIQRTMVGGKRFYETKKKQGFYRPYFFCLGLFFYHLPTIIRVTDRMIETFPSNTSMYSPHAFLAAVLVSR
jgi:hypothetical protein